MANHQSEKGVRLPLVGAQRDFVLYDQAHPGLFLGPKFLTVRGVRAEGPLDLGMLEAAASHLAATHEVLRVAFAADESRTPPMSQVVADEVNVPVEVSDWRHRQGDTVSGEVLRDFFTVLSLEVDQAPLFAVRVYELDDDLAVVCLGFHHMVMDGEGAEVATRKLWSIYDDLAAGRTPEPPAGTSWPEYCLGRADQDENEEELERARDFWQSFFAGGVETGFPVGPASRPELAGKAGIRYRAFDPALSPALDAAAREAGTLLGGFSAAVFARFLARQLDRDEVTFFATQTARVAPKVRELPGLMLLLLAVRGGTGDLRESARSIQQHIVGANRHAALSGALLRSFARPSPEDQQRFAEREVAVAFQLIPNRPVPGEAGGLRLQPLSRYGEDEGNSPCTWLEFHYRPGDDPHLLCRYDSGRFGDEQVEALLEALAAEFIEAAGTGESTRA